jgi:hypothetical protein
MAFSLRWQEGNPVHLSLILIPGGKVHQPCRRTGKSTDESKKVSTLRSREAVTEQPSKEAAMTREFDLSVG